MRTIIFGVIATSPPNNVVVTITKADLVGDPSPAAINEDTGAFNVTPMQAGMMQITTGETADLLWRRIATPVGRYALRFKVRDLGVRPQINIVFNQ